VPSTITDIFAAAGAKPAGVVPWGTAPAPPASPAVRATGIYVVALTAALDGLDGVRERAPISRRAVDALLGVRPELTLDERRPAAAELVSRLAGFWFPDEVAVYIGMAGARKTRPRNGELTERVSEYYTTPLGANGPHAGGWPLKTLTCLDELYVHYAYCENVSDAEGDCLGWFAKHVSDATRARLYDAVRVMPFANLAFPRGRPKAHGIRGARAPKRKRAVPGLPSKSVSSKPRAAPTRPTGTPHRPSQNVTQADITGGQVRVPGRTKSILPPVRGEVSVRLRGRELTCRWDPRYGPPERSGVIRVGKVAAIELLQAGDVLAVTVTADGVIVLR
jgi:hypothetical protein